MHRNMIFGTAAALALAACGGRDDEAANVELNNAAAELNAAAEAEANATAPVAASDFANIVAASDKYEVEAGNLAATRASSADVKSFAQMLVAAHTQSTADLKAAAGQASPPITPNDALDAEKQGMLSQLQGATGAAFDSAYLDQQITAHQKALSLLQTYAAGGDNEALKAFAAKAAPIVRGHLDKARSLKD